jgi:hypothetical protein
VDEENFYCGRALGVEVIPGTGVCGPNNGPQCSDCKVEWII